MYFITTAYFLILATAGFISPASPLLAQKQGTTQYTNNFLVWPWPMLSLIPAMSLHLEGLT